MAIYGPATQEEATKMNVDADIAEQSQPSVEVKSPDFSAPERFKNAPAAWESAGYSQYMPFTSVKPDAETFEAAVKEWQPYSESFVAATQAERYQVNEAEKVNLEALQELKDLPGNNTFARHPSLARRLNEDVAMADGFGEAQKAQLETKVGKNLNAIREYNTAGTKAENASKKTFEHAPIHPSDWLNQRLKFADLELSKQQRSQTDVVKACGSQVSQFKAQPKPVINAFQRTLTGNLTIEKKRADDAHLAEQMKRLELASKVRTAPAPAKKSYAEAARRKSKF